MIQIGKVLTHISEEGGFEADYASSAPETVTWQPLGGDIYSGSEGSAVSVSNPHRRISQKVYKISLGVTREGSNEVGTPAMITLEADEAVFDAIVAQETDSSGDYLMWRNYVDENADQSSIVRRGDLPPTPQQMSSFLSWYNGHSGFSFVQDVNGLLNNYYGQTISQESEATITAWATGHGVPNYLGRNLANLSYYLESLWRLDPSRSEENINRSLRGVQQVWQTLGIFKYLDDYKMPIVQFNPKSKADPVI